MRARRSSTADGFSLVEVLIAVLVLTAGFAGAAQLLALSIAVQADAQEASASMRLAEAKLNELLKSASDGVAAEVTPQGVDSLTADIPQYFDRPQAGTTRRWRLQAGPSGATPILTVRVINARARRYGAVVDLTTIIRPW